MLAALATACAAPPHRARTTQDARDPDADYRAEFQARDGLIVTARAQRAWLGGDFDGDTTLVGPDVIALPDADEGDGWELGIGGMNEGTAYLFTYGRSAHDGALGSLDADVDYRVFGLRVQHYLRANEPVQPYLTFAFLLPLAKLEDASTDGVVVGDAKLRDGFGASGGVGLAFWAGRRLGIDARLEYAYQTFGEAEGVLDDSETIDDAVDASMVVLSVGLAWIPKGFR